MSSDDIDLKKLSDLARLEIAPESYERLKGKLASTLEYVKQLMSVNVDGIEPMSHVHGISNVMREDISFESLTIDDLKQIAPEMNGRFIKVPLVVE
jgi:aspartyl-tRNA(Asn)/glutamyl-tRNA(Gln) amidotransferase subunit C